MSDKCGSCDCADKSQCVKKGSSYSLVIVETEKSYMDAVVMDAPAAEHNGKCKCGTSCSCVNCTCGH
ncbi:Metallothionein-like protein type [Parasponia andersonii]|uniref:Metallothionein-like protein type n=1 Tax=Parasponia andersonii TaxID=3476 RepID=A0A2P5D400_PARAD|nr:Metallothionein-like protein type [Parasponia andersonii]